MTWNQFWVEVLNALIPLLALAVTIAIAMLAEWLRRKAGQVQQDVVRESFLAAIFELERVANDAILATNQILVEKLKEAAADGKLTKEEAEAAMRMAVEYLQTHLTPGALQILQAAYGPIGAWIEEYLEAKLGALKWGQEAYAITVPPSSEAEV